MLKRDVYINEMKSQLDALNAQMAQLESRAQQAREDMRDSYRQDMDKLHAQSDLALAKLTELRASGENTWDNMVAEMDKIRDAFSHAYKDFKARV